MFVLSYCGERAVQIYCANLHTQFLAQADELRSLGRSYPVGAVKLLSLIACYILQKGKAIPLQAWTGPEGSRTLKFPDFKTIGT
jgi:hypothetical protein